LSPNGKEFAFQRDDALAFLDWCDNNGFEVTGYDVWAPTEPKPTDCYIHNIEGDSRTCRSAIANFDTNTFRQRLGKDPVFNIWAKIPG
jgi:hypothetical protein